MKATIGAFGFRSGVIAFTATVAFVFAQTLQLFGLLKYPIDEILIYGFSLCIVIPFLLQILALHHIAPEKKQFWTHAALIFTILYAVFVSANYVVQLATVIPATLSNTADEIYLLRQTPHSLFWDFDAMGYVFMGFATLFLIPVFDKQGFQKTVRYSLLLHSLVTPLIAFVYFYPVFSDRLLLIGIPWGITAPVFMLLLALQIRKGVGLEADDNNTSFG